MDRSVGFHTFAWILAPFAFGAGLAAVGMWRSAPQDTGGQEQELPPPTVPTAANADSNNRMIAVTGTDITGASILYLVDTVGYQLAVYQAVGGSDSTQGIRFVGARRIDLDLQLQGYNDRSQYPYKKLREAFVDKGLLPGSGAPAVSVPAEAGDDPSKKPSKN